MRRKRAERFKRQRRKKIRNIFVFTLVIPLMLLTVGYLVASLFILPVMNK